jgi:AraC-like DNA-binding protein
MLTFSTDGLPAKDRFAHWREERGKAVFGVTIELERERRDDFSGRFAALPVGGAVLVEMKAASYKVWRTEDDIAHAPSDALCIYQQIRGGGWFDAGGSEFVVGAGQIATSHSDLPYATAPATDEGFHLRLLKIPYARCKGLVETAQDLFARPLHIGPGLTALLEDYFNSFVVEARSLAEPGAHAAVQTLAQLALLARGMAVPEGERSRAAIRHGVFRKAQAIIAEHFNRPDLTPGLVAGLLGISVRQLHLLFEPTGVSFSRTVTAVRLAEARRMLQRDAKRPVADVAFACGFDSLATFYRVFRGAYGVSPGDIRAQRNDRG